MQYYSNSETETSTESESDDDSEVDFPLPSLQRVNAYRPPGAPSPVPSRVVGKPNNNTANPAEPCTRSTALLRRPSLSPPATITTNAVALTAPSFNPNLSVLHQYSCYKYLNHSKTVANAYLHELRGKLCVDVPDVIVSLCVSYFFVYDDGLFQLARHVHNVLDKWMMPRISRRALRTVVAHFFERESPNQKTLTQDEIEQLLSNLLRSTYIICMDLSSDGTYIAAMTKRGEAPKYLRLTE